jgi:nucleotide-binding universal stress UspA family protein
LLDVAAEQAKAFDARILLLHIVPEHGVPADSSFAAPVVMAPASPETIKDDYERLISLRDSLIPKGINVLIEQITEGTVEKLMEECRKWKADLIVVGSHHHATIYNWFVGTYTADVLKAAFCPVLVVPADAAAG